MKFHLEETSGNLFLKHLCHSQPIVKKLEGTFVAVDQQNHSLSRKSEDSKQDIN